MPDLRALSAEELPDALFAAIREGNGKLVLDEYARRLGERDRLLAAVEELVRVYKGPTTDINSLVAAWDTIDSLLAECKEEKS